MAVAKSYQNLEVIDTPYMINNKMFIKVRLKTGAVKQVRWYSEEEYVKYYGTKPDPKKEISLKDALGFKNGFITIFKGDTYGSKDWFKNCGARYTKYWGWSFSSEQTVPEILPIGLEAIKLDWDTVGNADDTLKNQDLIKSVIESLIYEKSNSEFQGAIGDRIAITVTIDKAIPVNGYYGMTIMHIMKDKDENVYVWNTASKNWAEGSTHTIRGTIKDHRIYKNIKQTVLSRCTEVNK